MILLKAQKNKKSTKKNTKIEIKKQSKEIKKNSGPPRREPAQNPGINYFLIFQFDFF